MQKTADALEFGDSVWFENIEHHVIERTPNDTGTTNLWLSPTDGLGLDAKFSVPNNTIFNVINPF